MIGISVLVELAADQWDRLAIGAGDATLFLGGAIDACEIVFGNPEPGQIKTAEALKWVQLESVGFGEYLDLDWARLEGRVTLTNLAGFFADPVAESALAGILGLMRGVDRLVAYQGAMKWVGDPVRAELRLLKSSHVVFLGYGSINRRLAELLVPFQCRITPLGSTSPVEELERALAAADVLVAAVPETPATCGLMNARRLAMLPAHAIFVNLGRGSLVNEPALCDALHRGKLAGAVLDVTGNEPLSIDDPLWSCPNTILTQHSGGGSHDEYDRKIDYFLANLARYRHGKPLQGVVDIKRGY